MINRIATVNEMQFVFLLEEGMIDAMFILRRLQEEYLTKRKKLYVCFVDLEKAFDRVLGWAMRKKGTLEVLLLMNMYEGAKTRVRDDCEFGIELWG